MGMHVDLQGPYGNVVAFTTWAKPAVVLGAHFDSVPGTPGADDNASALAVLVEVARRLHDVDGLVFVAFNGEEDHLLGSASFVQSCLDDKRPLKAAHVLEMVGFCSHAPHSQKTPVHLPGVPTVGDFILVVGNAASRSLVDDAYASSKSGLGPKLLAVKPYMPLEALVPDVERSDHAPFWKAGVPAVMWTDTAEFRNRTRAHPRPKKRARRRMRRIRRTSTREARFEATTGRPTPPTPPTPSTMASWPMSLTSSQMPCCAPSPASLSVEGARAGQARLALGRITW